jgi:hypothetical protein
MVASRSTPPALKEQLREEASGKCANPGCPTQRTHIHHIAEWAVYETHDGDDMVAVCPTCHDAIHHGKLPIDDETVRRWKAIPRSGAVQRAHLYVEPPESEWPKFLFGQIAITGASGVTVFDIGPSAHLGFELADGELMLADLAVATRDGEEILRVVANHMRYPPKAGVEFEAQPGHIRATAPVTDRFLPAGAIEHLRIGEPGFAQDGRLVLLDLEVVEPGRVRVQGIWSGPGGAVVATTRALYLVVGPEMIVVALWGDKGAELFHAGLATTPLFGFGGAPAMIRVPDRTSSLWSQPGSNR